MHLREYKSYHYLFHLTQGGTGNSSFILCSIPEVLPCSCIVPAGEKVAVSLPVLTGHEDVDDGVDAGGQVDHDVAGYGHQGQGGVGHNLQMRRSGFIFTEERMNWARCQYFTDFWMFQY